ncbi:MAG: efflux RND transporter periplasmic adaptor subunit [Bacteroidetes bacterium]|nr:efflux RND transporter periplasmic adaptor subunit [Bacteroidota bacterium]
MKKKLNNSKVLISCMIIIVFAMCDKREKSANSKLANSLFSCPMDPQIISKTQGKCPICKMKLELKTNVEIQSISPSKQVLSSQKTIKISESDFSNNYILSGITAIAADRNKTVPAKFGGRIEKLYIKYNYKYISTGEKIMEIYSPELVSMQEEFLFLLKTKSDKNLILKSKQKLILSGISQNQVEEIERTGIVKNTITIYSPYSGFAIFNNQNIVSTPQSKQQSDGGMNMGNNETSEPNYLMATIAEGSYVNNRSTLFVVNDMKTKWIWISVPSENINEIELNMLVKLELKKGIKLNTNVSFIEKNTDYTTSKFSRIRVTVPDNENKILIDMPVNAEVLSNKKSEIRIPKQAVFFTGTSAIVWLKTGTLPNGNGVFSAKHILTGEISNNKVEILNGLKIGDEIATNAGLMVDSETIIN